MQRLNKTLTAGILLATVVLTIFSILWALSPSAAATAPTGVSLPEANKILAQYAFEELLNDGRLAVADEIFAPNFRQHAPNLPAVTLGSKGVKLLATLYRSAFFDLHYTIEDMVAAGDKVVIRWTASGLHQRPFGLYPPSRKQVTWTGVTIYRIANGQIVEAWTNQDELNFIQQIGATTFTEVTWGPSYSADGAMSTTVTNRDNPDLVITSAAITWGPSYYADDTTVEAGRNRPELELMQQVDLNALKGVTEGPSYHQ